LNRFRQITLRAALYLLASAAAFLLLAGLLLRMPAVQTWLVGKVARYVEGKVGTPVRIGYVNVAFPKKIVLQDVYFEGQNRDTLLAAERLLLDIDMLKLFRKTLEINYLCLDGATAKIRREGPDGDFNFGYILRAFPGGKESPRESENGTSALAFNIGEVAFKRIRFAYWDETAGMSADIRLQQFRTNIKTFDLTGDMAFALPDIRLHGLTATIEQWAAASGEEIPDTATVQTASRLPEISLKNMALSNAIVRYRNSSTVIDTRFAIQKLTAHLEGIDLNEQTVRLGKIALDGSDSEVIFGMIDRKPKAVSGFDWTVSARQLTVNQTDFSFRDNGQARRKGFDPFNIAISGLAGELADLHYAADSISGSLKSLAAADHSGFGLKELRGDFVYTSTGAEVRNLLARTAKSTVRDYLRVSYPDLETLTEHPENLYVETNIRRSVIDMRDVRHFLPDLDTVEMLKPLLARSFTVHGKMKGRMDDLRIPRMELKTLDNTRLVASATVTGLPDPEKTTIDLTIEKLTTGRVDLERMIDRSLLPERFRLPDVTGLSGTLRGGKSGFSADLHVAIDRGNATLCGKVELAQDTSYDLRLAAENIDLGHLLRQDSVFGRLSAEGSVQGVGLDPKKMQTDVRLAVNRLEAKGYRYHEIQLDAWADGGDIAGKLTSSDPNVRLRADFSADLRGQYPKVRAEMMVDSVNLQKLNLSDVDFRYHGKITADFETADINFLNGAITVFNTSIAYQADRLTLDTISLRAVATENRHTMLLKSEILNAHMVGRYRLSELGTAVQDVIRTYYNPDGAPSDSAAYSRQQFEFSATLKNARAVRDFLPKLEQLREVTLDGIFDSRDKSLSAKLLAPGLVYDGKQIADVSMGITRVDSTLYYNASAGKIKLNDIELINTVLSGSVRENKLDIGLWIKDKNNREQYRLAAKMEVHQNNYLLSLLEDGLMLNYENWNIAPGNQLRFGRDGLGADRFRLDNGGRELSIQSRDPSRGAPLHLVFRNFRLETFTQILAADGLNLGGGINGTATVSNVEGRPVFVSALTVDRLHLGRDTIGNVQIDVHTDRQNVYSADVRISGYGNDVRLRGAFSHPPQGKAEISATLSLRPMKMVAVQAFSMGYLADCAGDLSGELKIGGTTDAPRVDGELTFGEAKINIAMLNADLFMDKQSVRFDHQGIQFRRFEVKDSRGNAARLNGTVRTATYRDFAFNLNLTSNDFEAVSSSRKDNDLFYGKLYVTSNLRITGNSDSPAISGNVRANDKTDLVLLVPNDNPGVAERDGVVKFVDRGRVARPNVFARLDEMATLGGLAGYSLTLDLSTDREAKFRIVLDEGTQDALNIQGVAQLSAGIDAADRISLSGTFTVEKGNYTFSLGPVSKPFTFQKGSTIAWKGDPFDARLDITALYSDRFPTLELVQPQIGAESPGIYRQRIPFDVKLILGGDLFSPELDFDIALNERQAMASQDVIAKVGIALANLRSDPDEMYKQVFSLIVLGRFMTSNPFESLAGGTAGSTLRNTLGGMLGNELSKLASNLVAGLELDFDLRSENDYLTGQAETRTDLNVGISKMLFDDRLQVTIGSNFEVEGGTRPGERASNIAGDISLDYQLSKDGRYFARLYRKNQYQATLQGEFVETGLGFVVNMSYDRFRELLMSTRRLEQLYDTDSRSFRRRFDVERMETDSLYRDSVSTAIRDSLMRHNPDFRRRWEERQREELKKQDEKTDGPDIPEREMPTKAVRNEEEERNESES